MKIIPDSRRHRVRNVSLALASLLIGVFAPLSLTKGNHVVGGNSTLIVAWSVIGTVVFVWFVTTDMVRFRLPSISFQRQGRNRTLVFSPPQKPLRGKRDVKQRAETFARSVLEFLAEWDRGDPLRGPHWAAVPGWDVLTEEEKGRVFQEHTQNGLQYFSEQMNRYSVEYSIEALALFDEFHARGLARDEDRHIFERPTNTFGVREIAQKLGVWAKQL